MPRGKHIQRVAIVHGFGGSSAIHWQSWLARKCGRVLKIETHYPKLPDKHSPCLSAWLEALNRILPVVDETTALVGHSLGCTTILQLLRHRQDIQHIGLVVLVAPSTFANVRAALPSPSLSDFFDGLHAHATLTALCTKIKAGHIFASNNDVWVNPGAANALATLLNASFHFMPGASHINVASGYHTFPEVLSLLTQT